MFEIVTVALIELLVVGIGALMWTTLALLAITGYRDVAAVADASLALLFAIALAYVLGTVVDRVADALFQSRADRLRERFLGDDQTYQRLRTQAHGLPLLGQMIEYNRSRLRICRGWALNAVILAVVSPLPSCRCSGRAHPTSP
jgi:hypothetical protein